MTAELLLERQRSGNCTQMGLMFEEVERALELSGRGDELLPTTMMGVHWQHWPLHPPTPQLAGQSMREPAGHSMVTRLQMLVTGSIVAVQSRPPGQETAGMEELEKNAELKKEEYELLFPSQTQHCPLQPLTPQTVWHRGDWPTGQLSVCLSQMEPFTRIVQK